MYISLSEIMVVLVVALLVIKPEQLPGALQQLGRWLRWAQETIAKVKHDMTKPVEKLISSEKPLGESDERQ